MKILLFLMVVAVVYLVIGQFGLLFRQRALMDEMTAVKQSMRNWAEEVDRNVNVYIQAYAKSLLDSLTAPELEKIIDSSYGEEI